MKNYQYRLNNNTGIILCINELKGQVPISQLSWKSVATSMPDEWYGSEESKAVAENVLLYQKMPGTAKNTLLFTNL